MFLSTELQYLLCSPASCFQLFYLFYLVVVFCSCNNQVTVLWCYFMSQLWLTSTPLSLHARVWYLGHSKPGKPFWSHRPVLWLSRDEIPSLKISWYELRMFPREVKVHNPVLVHAKANAKPIVCLLPQPLSPPDVLLLRNRPVTLSGRKKQAASWSSLDIAPWSPV